VGGSGTVISQMPYLRQDENGTITVILDGTSALFFDDVSGSYEERFYLQEQLTYDSLADTFSWALPFLYN
jgi:hypothetical protein